VAVGIDKFAHVPAFASRLRESVASHTRAHPDFSRFEGASVAVVGGGQSAIESAALLHEAGAQVELIARGPIRWLKLHDYRGPGRRLLYAPTDVGPPGLNWLLHFPLVFRHFPARAKRVITRRAVKPAGARWLIDRIVGKVRLTTHAEVVRATEDTSGICLELSDGTSRRVDHVLLGTGYKPSVHKLPFMPPSLRDAVRQRDGFPILNRWLESSVPGLHFVGGLADPSYGPICRFVSGADVAARQIAAYAARTRGT
jgi:cation diffusion facilitator CzcD-associated flavoprotein CzcO